ncbi:MAG: Efflux ABC transporter, permease protein, partial [uncultured Ramlibacter sp.]
RAAERLRQQLVVADPEQDHGQPGVRAADAAVALELVLRLRGFVHRARPVRGPGGADRHLGVRPARLRRAAVDPGVRGARGGDARRPGPDRRALGREVRPDGGVPELRHHADDVPLGRLLLHPLAARFLAAGEPPQPFLLHDRRVSLWFLRGERRLALAQFGDRGDGHAGGQRHRSAPASHRLQDPGM